MTSFSEKNEGEGEKKQRQPAGEPFLIIGLKDVFAESRPKGHPIKVHASLDVECGGLTWFNQQVPDKTEDDWSHFQVDGRA